MTSRTDDAGGGTRAIAQRLLDELDAVVELLGERYREVPAYDALSDGAMRAEVLPMSRRVVGAFLEGLLAGSEPSRDVLDELGEIGRRRLDMGVPLEPMLHVYRIAGRTVWETALRLTSPGEERALTHLGTLWMDWIDRAASVAAAAYLDASHERVRHLDARRGALLQAVLAAADGAEVAAVATEFATPLSGAYAPVVVAGEGVAAGIDKVLSALAPGTLAGPHGAHLLALVPDAAPGAATAPALAALSAAFPAAWIGYGRSTPPGRELRAEVAEVDALVAAALRRGPGVYGTRELVLERLVHASPRIAADLAAAIGGLLAEDRHGLVVETLEAYLASGSIPATAAAVAVHPNTVVYRLRRVAERTGLDPRVPADAALLALALAAR